VDLADSISTGNTAVVTATVTLLYEASKKRKEPLELASALTQSLALDESKPNFAFTTDSSFVTFVFHVQQDASSVLDVRNASAYSSKEIGLMVVTVFLSCVLLIVSSVLLHITGGWKICMNKVTNCLFEEIDEEEYVIQQQKTFPIQNSEDDDHVEEDLESNITSVPPSSASGILGVARNKNFPPLSLGMETPGNDEEDSSTMYGDGMTPLSRTNQVPLGITSMRKLPQPDDHSPRNVKGGFSGMVMQRIARSGSKKK
jgi:hypothetical protein